MLGGAGLAQEPKLSLIPLGGLGEIGKNMMVVKYGEDIVVIDCGLMFPEDEMLGIDIVIPDITYLLEHQHMVHGIVLTHGHEDHIGALPYVLRQLSVPVYGTRLTLGLLQGKLKERGVEAALNPVKPRDIVQIGPFKVEFIRVCHSIPDAVAIAVHTPVGLVVHTGDFKIDQTPVDGQVTDFQRLAQLGEKGVKVLLSDSTNAEIPGQYQRGNTRLYDFRKYGGADLRRNVSPIFREDHHRHLCLECTPVAASYQGSPPTRP